MRALRIPRRFLPFLFIGLLLTTALPAAAAEPFPLDPVAGHTSNARIAPSPDGTLLAAWTRGTRVGQSFGPDFHAQDRVVVRRLSALGEPLGPPLQVVDFRLDSFGGGGIWALQVASARAGEGVVAWMFKRRIELQALAGDAAVGGPVVPVTCAGSGNDRLRSFELVASGDGYWLAWNEICPGLRIAARRLDLRGRPIGPELVLAETHSPGATLDLAPTTDGGFVATWVEDDGEGGRRVFARRLRSPGAGLEPAFAVSPPVTPSLGPVTPAVTVLADGTTLFAWNGENDRIVVRSLPPEGPPGPVLPAGAGLPAGTPIVSPELPGFRVWVRFGGDEPNARLGMEEPLCLPETVCVSGAIPGRSEVFLRIVGPKPNGFLWPTIVRFSTATVEVWIEQSATRTLRYYRLAGATPGSEDLTGLFDRHGFRP